MSQLYIVDKNGTEIDAQTATKPDERYFRNAWVVSGTVITEDVPTAKELFRQKIREVRKPLLEAEDVVFMKALESGDTSAQSASATKKQQLRDAPGASAIESATTISELTAAWDTDLLGANPYSE